MEFDETKENIQPLRGGRNAEHMEYVFVSPEQWEQERKTQEETIESYEGDDPLLPWYNYFLWVEQTNVSNFKPPAQEQALRRCVQLFENNAQYMQDHRFIKLCIKYIDSQPAPVDLYNELYNRGVGTLCAELYIAWAYYYDAVDNFAKTEEVFQKGLRAGAEPKADLEQAHKTFGFSMSQRLLHKDECSKIRFQTTLDERRNALTSLRASRGKKHVGSVRTGLAVKSYQPGIVNQENTPRNTGAGNGPSNANVYTDEPGTSSDSGSSIVRPFSSVHSEPENIIEAARLAKTNVPTNHRKLFGTHQAPSFDIPVDEEAFQPLPVLVDNCARGTALPAQFCRRSKPQTPFEVGICVGDPKERAIPVYDKIRLYCRAAIGKGKGPQEANTDFSPEELRAYGYFVRRGIENQFTRERALVWGRGCEVGIRLHPLHVQESKCTVSEKAPFPNPTLEECDSNIQTKVQEMYADPSEERSIEELLQERWLKGKIKKCIDRRYQDDIDPVDMDETHVESKRISMGAARFSMAPPGWTVDAANHAPTRQRKSFFPAHPPASCINEETEEDASNRNVAAAASSEDAPQSRKRPSNDVLEQEVSKREDFTPTPLKNVVAAFTNQSGDGSETSGSPSTQKATEKVEIFVDDSDENDEREPETDKLLEPPQSCYPNDTCSTQMFNLFVKNISTPVAPVRKPSTTSTTALTTKRMVVFVDDEEPESNAGPTTAKQMDSAVETRTTFVSIPGAVMINDENAVPAMEPSTTPPSVSSGCNSTQNHKQLSTIMERTESSTASSSAAVGVTKSPAGTQVHSPDAFTATGIDAHTPPESATETVFREPDEPAGKSVFPLAGDDGKGFCIHIDSTETMANVPLKRLPLPATSIVSTDDKENELITRATGTVTATGPPAGRTGVFQLSDEPTFSGYGFVGGTAGAKNVSHLAQRELDANSIVSFRMGTERTNTVPLHLVKPMCAIPEVAAAVAPTCAGSAPNSENVVPKAKEPQRKNNSLLDLLDATFSPKVTGEKADGKGSDGLKVDKKEGEKRKDCSLNLSDLLKSPQAKATAIAPIDLQLSDNRLSLMAPTAPLSASGFGDLSLLPMGQIKLEKSLNIDASLALPNFLISAPPPAPPVKTAPIERVVLDDFPSPLPPPGSSDRASLDDINTMVFSLNINHAVNSTIVQQDGFTTPSKHSAGGDAKPQPPRQPLLIVDVQGGVAPAPPVQNAMDAVFRKPALPLQALSVGVVQQKPTVSIPTEVVENDADVSIYHPRPAISQEAELWDEIDQQSDGEQHKKEYLHKTIDMDGTVQQINAHIATDDIDPFERQLLEAFLDRVDFLTYISELPCCLMMNVVHPLRKDALVQMKEDGVTFRVQQKIGKGSYGSIFCATEKTTGEKVAMKQERPANLWEFYICLELRSRIENPDILPGFMQIDYAIIGNNASIFVSPFSQYGTILDVCNLINGATNRNMDEFIAMVLTAQMLSIVDHLHSCQIIHADIKPDNFLVMGPIELNSKVPCIQLIDFGVSIDMKLFPDDAKFKKVITTDGFTCIEMLENKHWTYQPDLYGVAATSHVMLFGKYMQVQKNIVNYGIKTTMPRYFKKVVWENYFTTLLNIRDCEHLPNLQQLRAAFLEEITLHEKYIKSKISEFNLLLATCK